MLRMSRRLWIPIVAVAALALLGSAGAYVYFFSGLRTSPPSLALASPGASPATDASANAGTWQIATGSVVGYRVKEQFVGQASSHEAVARTGDVTGQVTIAQTGSSYQMTSAQITVQLSGLASVDSVAGYNVTNRDRIVQRSLDVTQFPSAVLTLRSVAIPSGADGGQTVTFQVAGDLTIRGVTRAVTATVQLRAVNGAPQIVATIQTDMTDFGVQPPSIGFTTVQPAVTIEAQLSFSR